MANAPTFTLTFIIRVNRTVNNKAPIFARITVNSRRTEFAIKRSISPDSWNPERGMARAKTREANEINPLLEKIRKRILECHAELLLAGKEVTGQMLKQHFFGEDEQVKGSAELFEYHNATSKSTLAPGTYKHYLTTQRYFNDFIKKKFGVQSIRLNAIDYRLLNDFEFFLRKKSGRDKVENLATNTTMKHFCRLRKMLNLAERLEWITKTPFKIFKLKFEVHDRGFLYEYQLAELENLPLTNDRLRAVRDMFIFSCYTGIPFADLQLLTTENIIQGIDGHLWLNYNRKKTGNAVRLPILPKVMQIIEDYRDYPKLTSTNYLLPRISNQKMNKYLKELALLCGIQTNLTFHIARHTFATTVTLSNGVPIETVSKVLGHTKISTTQIYAKVVEQKISDDLMDLYNKMDKKENDKKIPQRKLSLLK